MDFIKRFLLAIIFCFFILGNQLFSQKGFPFYKYYSPIEYSGHPQVWNISEIDHNKVAFATTAGIIIYDGTSFKNILKGTSIRTIHKPSNTTKIYFGGDDVFGHFYYDSLGRIQYNIWSDSLPDSLRDFVVILGVHQHNDTIFWVGLKRIFVYVKNTLYKTFKAQTAFYFSLKGPKNNLYTYIPGKGLCQITSEALHYPPPTLFVSSPVNSTYPLNDSTMVVAIARPSRLVLYSPRNFKTKPLETEAAAYLDSNGISALLRLKDGSWAIGTVSGGTVILSKDFKHIKSIINDKDKISSLYVSCIYQDHSHTIWIGTGNGFISVYYNIPAYYIPTKHLLEGIAIGMTRISPDKLFLATTSGAFIVKETVKSVRNHYTGLEKVKTVYDSQTMSLINLKDQILFAGRFGIYSYNKKTEQQVVIDTNLYLIVKESRYNKQLFFASRIDGLLVFKRNANHDFIILNNNIKTYKSIDNIYEKDPLNLLLVSKDGEFFEIHFSDTTYQKFQLKKLSFPEELSPRFFVLEDTLYSFNSQDSSKVYFLDQSNKLIESRYYVKFLHGTTQNAFPQGNLIFRKNEKYILSSGFSLCELYIRADTIYIDDYKFRAIKTAGVFATFKDTAKHLIWGLTPDFFLTLSEKSERKKVKYNCIITQIKLNNDSVLGYDNISATINLPYRYNDLSFFFSATFYEMNSNIKFSYKLEGFDNKWSQPTKENFTKYTNIAPGTYTFKVKALNTYGEYSSVATFHFTILPPWYMTWWAYLLFTTAGIGLIVLIVHLYSRRLKAANERLEKLVNKRTKELKQKNEELQEKNTLITHSIEYAKKIQDAILPTEKDLQAMFPESFIIFSPRDIVSGDFFWLYRLSEHESLVVVSDCTGHGVPGAFMSMIGNTLLNEIVKEKKVHNPAAILENIHMGIIKSLQTKEEAKIAADGMDMVVCKIDTQNREIQLASANQNAFFFADDKFIACYGDPYSIGDPFAKQSLVRFSNFNVTYKHSVSIYLTSDGYFDQFGGSENKKFTITRFIDLLKEIKNLPMPEQKKIFEAKFKEWKKHRLQIDDILVVGIKIAPNK